jgi:DNA adenine methylase
MKYMGSKARHAKELLPIILANRKDEQWYVEPFVGGANMIDKVDGKRIGADSNAYLIALLRHCEQQKSHDLPSRIYEDDYNDVKNNQDNYSPFIVGHIGFNASFGSKFFGGYARPRKSTGYDRDLICGKNSLIKKMPLIEGVKFTCSKYKNLEIPPSSIIYCDPPYANTTGYKDKFDHKEFWQWCREKCEEGHDVFISEYNAPDDFVCVWEKSTGVSVAKEGKHKKATEKLFRHKSQFDAMIDAGVV